MMVSMSVMVSLIVIWDTTIRSQRWIGGLTKMVFVMANVAATFQESLIERVTNNTPAKENG